MRWLVFVLLLACSKETKPPPPREAPKPVVQAAPNRFPARQHTPADDEIAEEWTREIADPHDRDVHGVSATKGRSGRWLVTVYVMEFIRDVPLEAQLRRRIVAAVLAVPGVEEAAEDDREVWSVRGEPSGAALVDAVAAVVDDLATQARQEIDRSLAP